MTTRDRVSDGQINAYLDKELSAAERADVEIGLSRDPDLACRAMTDLYLANALRLPRPERRHRPETIAAAERLGRALVRRRWMSRLRSATIAASLLAAGWTGNMLWTTWAGSKFFAGEAFAEKAREASLVAALDQSANGGWEPIAQKLDRLEATADVDLPEIPADWTVTDARLQPMHGRTGVVVTAEAAEAGSVTLVAAPVDTEGAMPPTPAEDETRPAVYWQQGATAYALTGDAEPDLLQELALTIETAGRRTGRLKTRG